MSTNQGAIFLPLQSTMVGPAFEPHTQAPPGLDDEANRNFWDNPVQRGRVLTTGGTLHSRRRQAGPACNDLVLARSTRSRH